MACADLGRYVGPHISHGTLQPPHAQGLRALRCHAAMLPCCHAAMLQARLTTQAVVVGDHLWLIGGWDPQEAGTGGVFLNDVWRLDLRSYAWEQVEVQVGA